MSASAASLTAEEYEQRKQFSEEIRHLTKTEMEEIYRTLKESKAEYSENSNGVFFDVSKLPADIFLQLQKLIIFCKANREEFIAREEEYKRAQEAIANGGD